MSGRLRRGTILFSIVLAALVPAGGIAAAQGPGPTPNEGLTGACNMTNSHAAFGMFERAPQSGPGFEGMIRAIINTGGDCF